MNQIEKELEVGEIHARDRWQFELKSEFIPSANLRENTFTEEFYVFIPNALQVNRNSYQKEQFYLDQINLVRYKTPQFTLKQLMNPENSLSPINRLMKLTQGSTSQQNREQLEDEMKLLGNIIRSSLRDRIGELIEAIQTDEPEIANHILLYCEDARQLRICLTKIQTELVENWTGDIRDHYDYVDEFISNTISYSFTVLLQALQKKTPIRNSEEATQAVIRILSEEKSYRIKHLHESPEIPENEKQQEYIFYRSGLLKKFVLDALRLSTARTGVQQRYQHLVGAVAAGVAMSIFLAFFVWGGTIFAIYSLPYILITIILYILKDRIKEGFKLLSFQWMLKGLYDYKTEMRGPNEKHILGYLKESFSFIQEAKLPKEITDIRNREFHAVLEKIPRPERVIYYKKTIVLKQAPLEGSRRNSLNMISRFNVEQFLRKADEPMHSYTEWDEKKQMLTDKELPKVYHLNIIMRNTFLNHKKEKVVELKKYRLILDKNGIKRVEHLSSH